MHSRLIVKNFGPIDFVDLDLRNVNVFIGPQASGKSALAKIYTIFKAPRKFLKDENNNSKANRSSENSFNEILEEYNISSFLKSNTEIQFESELHSIEYKDDKLVYLPKVLNKIQDLEILATNFKENHLAIKRGIQELGDNFVLFEIRVITMLEGNDPSKRLTNFKKFQELDEADFSKIVSIIKEIEANLSTNTALYIPAERNFINIIKNYSLSLLHNNVPIPKHILSFGAELEKAPIKEIDLKFLQKDLFYKSIDGEDRIFTDEKHSIKLSEAASGIQSVLPILIPILFRKSFSEHRSFVIEEPELNLFPVAQYGLIKQLESSRRESYWEDYGTIHTYTTHSPYILSAINNLLYAHKVKSTIRLLGNTEGLQSEEKLVTDIIPAEINPYYFTAYQICNGKAESIFDRETGLIKENYIDEASDKIGDDFEALMDLKEKYSITPNES